ncbi:MAG: hypothetical protein AAFO62_04310 [Pseudomonadota bacterium]
MTAQSITAATLFAVAAAGLSTSAQAGFTNLGVTGATADKAGHVILINDRAERRKKRRAERRAANAKRGNNNRGKKIVERTIVVEKPVVRRKKRSGFGITLNFGRDRAPRVIVGRPAPRFGRRIVRRGFGRVATPRINNRIQNQARRIRNGVRNGSLRPRQGRRLQNRLGDIRAARRFARADGVVTRGERRRLMNMLDRLGNRIRRAKVRGRFL